MKKTKNINIKTKYTDSDNYQKHFTLDDRIKIQKIITDNRDEKGNMTIMLKDIGNMLSNDPSTISKEVKKHRIFNARYNYSTYSLYNSICSKYESCDKKCLDRDYKYYFMKKITKCIDKCEEFESKKCKNITHFPWVCNGCSEIKRCRLDKYFYYSDIADKEYKNTLSESRIGIDLSKDEFDILNHIVSDAIKQSQPIYHISETNDLPVCARTIYNYIEKGYMIAKNIDLRRKVTYKKRKNGKIDKTLLRKIKHGRTFEDYQVYLIENPDASVVQMDTVMSGQESNKCLLTLHFVKFHFQIARLLPNKEVESVNNALNEICDDIGIELFQVLFEVILTDNGSEFSNPEAIEYEPKTGELRSHVFYCHPYSSYEKGSCEKNHEYIRYILPKGTSFADLNQDKVDLMMSHINSTKRPSIKASPYDYMALTYGVDVLDKLKIKKIDSNLVTLSPKLIK
jgi:IS30 family transposase